MASPERRRHGELGKDSSEASKIPSVDSDGKNPQPFFKNNRLQGGWSSEACSIEKNLGVGG